jgi:benzoylformate decarboxylase
VVLNNGGYAIMDRLAEKAGGAGPWPTLEGIDLAGLSRAQGVETLSVSTLAELERVLDDALPMLAGRTAPLVLDVAVAPDATFDA